MTARFAVAGPVALLCLASMSASAGVIRVPSEQPNIQAGIDAASAGDTVLVAPGTYTGVGNREIVMATPGILVGSEAGAAATVIDCEGHAPAITVDDPGDTSTVIYGLTFTGGVGSSVYPGAIYTIGPVTLRDCVFDGNQSHTGGAIKLWDGHTYVIERCVFTNNRATYWGGAISNHYSRLLMRDCVFWNNESGQDGGAVGMMGGQGRFSGCTFIGNSGDPSGAIGCEYMTVQEIEIERCIIAFSQAGVGVDSEFALTEVSHCYVYSNAGGDSLPDASHDNEFDDPRLCDITTGDVALCADSPCLVSSPHNPWGVAIGALGQGCVACGSAVAPVSWGHLKAMYRAQD